MPILNLVLLENGVGMDGRSADRNIAELMLRNYPWQYIECGRIVIRDQYFHLMANVY